ncbi:MAG TPA: alpha/beta hydrolase [Candidatus Dormibacteraeota bacterium]|nr:alpha/beta hydrolase [Candidatus Dormibacteraeota bacterium]
MEQRLESAVTLHVVDQGQGSPIVFVHGVMMSGRFFEAQVSGLSAGHRVIVPDLRGHGQSEKVLSGHTVANYAQDLHLLLREREVVRPLLVGWSMGAMVVYEYLKAFGSGSVAGIVIVDQPPSDFAWDGYPFGVLTVESLAEMVEGLQLDQRAVAEEFAGLMQHHPREEVSAWMVEEILRVPAAVASTILVNQTLRDYRPFLPEIHCPALVAFGADPKLTPPEAGRFLASQIPDARFELFEDSSHCPFLEEPDRFNAMVADFAKAVASRP